MSCGEPFCSLTDCIKLITFHSTGKAIGRDHIENFSVMYAKVSHVYFRNKSLVSDHNPKMFFPYLISESISTCLHFSNT